METYLHTCVLQGKSSKQKLFLLFLLDQTGLFTLIRFRTAVFITDLSARNVFSYLNFVLSGNAKIKARAIDVLVFNQKYLFSQSQFIRGLNHVIICHNREPLPELMDILPRASDICQFIPLRK